MAHTRPYGWLMPTDYMWLAHTHMPGQGLKTLHGHPKTPKAPPKKRSQQPGGCPRPTSPCVARVWASGRCKAQDRLQGRKKELCPAPPVCRHTGAGSATQPLTHLVHEGVAGCGQHSRQPCVAGGVKDHVPHLHSTTAAHARAFLKQPTIKQVTGTTCTGTRYLHSRAALCLPPRRGVMRGLGKQEAGPAVWLLCPSIPPSRHPRHTPQQPPPARAPPQHTPACPRCPPAPP